MEKKPLNRQSIVFSNPNGDEIAWEMNYVTAQLCHTMKAKKAFKLEKLALLLPRTKLAFAEESKKF